MSHATVLTSREIRIYHKARHHVSPDVFPSGSSSLNCEHGKILVTGVRAQTGVLCHPRCLLPSPERSTALPLSSRPVTCKAYALREFVVRIRNERNGMSHLLLFPGRYEPFAAQRPLAATSRCQPYLARSTPRQISLCNTPLELHIRKFSLPKALMFQ